MPSPPPAFESRSSVRMVYGVNSLERLGELARELGMTKTLLVTDAGIVAAGHVARAVGILERVGISTACFDRTEENPGTLCVAKCVETAQAGGINGIIGLGGGSSLDTAKGCNFLITNGGTMQDYWGYGRASRPMLPLIAIPTTAGTGSECQSYALITDEKTHQKMACGDPKAAARIALLDPQLTVSQPERVTACTGLDVIAHAVETAVTWKRNPVSLIYSHRAFALAVNHLPKVLADPLDLEARGWMLMAAAFAGMAIENSMLGAAHAAANPLTAHFGISHGQAVAVMLPRVVQFNSQDPPTLSGYKELALAAGWNDPHDSPEIVRDSFIRQLNHLLECAKMPRSLQPGGVPESALPALASEAARQWTAQFNPRPLTESDFLSIYQSAWAD